MNKQDLELYRHSLKQERQAAIDIINVRFDRKLAALDVLLEDSNLPNASARTEPPTQPQAVRAKNLAQAIIEAVSKADTVFSSVTLYAYIRAHYAGFAEQPTDLSNMLWRLKKDGMIEVVEQGSGRNPSTYRKTTLFNASH